MTYQWSCRRCYFKDYCVVPLCCGCWCPGPGALFHPSDYSLHMQTHTWVCFSWCIYKHVAIEMKSSHSCGWTAPFVDHFLTIKTSYWCCAWSVYVVTSGSSLCAPDYCSHLLFIYFLMSWQKAEGEYRTPGQSRRRAPVCLMLNTASSCPWSVRSSYDQTESTCLSLNQLNWLYP